MLKDKAKALKMKEEVDALLITRDFDPVELCAKMDEYSNLCPHDKQKRTEDNDSNSVITWVCEDCGCKIYMNEENYDGV